MIFQSYCNLFTQKLGRNVAMEGKIHICSNEVDPPLGHKRKKLSEFLKKFLLKNQ
jgi:hypothetical protein